MRNVSFANCLYKWGSEPFFLLFLARRDGKSNYMEGLMYVFLSPFFLPAGAHERDSDLIGTRMLSFFLGLSRCTSSLDLRVSHYQCYLRPQQCRDKRLTNWSLLNSLGLEIG